MSATSGQEPSEVNYELISPFQYARKGDMAQVDSISLFPPTMTQHAPAANLKQLIYRIYKKVHEEEALKKRALDAEAKKNNKEKPEDETEEPEDETEKPEDETENSRATQEEVNAVVSAIYLSDEVHANAVWEKARALLISGVAKVDGDVKLSASLINKMSITDFEQMTASYIVNFTLA